MWAETGFTQGSSRLVKRDVERGGDVPREIGAVWEVAAASLIPKNVTSGRSIALLPTLIRWWGWLPALGVGGWQERHRVEWSAIEGRNGLGNAARDGHV